MTSRQKAVFITGAAAGIGRATALTFARNGYTIGGYESTRSGSRHSPTTSTTSAARPSRGTSTSPKPTKWRCA
jgi:NAD(P)-dependent dehydrogenase (short-subunit alcohol dehydrogenase family)